MLPWVSGHYTFDGRVAATGEARVVRFPMYENAGHMVTVTRAAEFREEVAAYRTETKD